MFGVPNPKSAINIYCQALPRLMLEEDLTRNVQVSQSLFKFEIIITVFCSGVADTPMHCSGSLPLKQGID
jgi:hypothetical protein